VNAPTSNALVPLLRTLRDIEGVHGSFLLGERGELLSRDVPETCGTEVLAGVGRRLHQLRDAFVWADIGAAFESTTLSFAQYKLHMRALGGRCLVAVTTAEVNVPALRMAIHMLDKRLQQALSVGFSPPDRASAPPALRASSAGAEPSSLSPERSYRGSRFSG
jgi:hypothetical protein